MHIIYELIMINCKFLRKYLLNSYWFKITKIDNHKNYSFFLLNSICFINECKL